MSLAICLIRKHEKNIDTDTHTDFDLSYSLQRRENTCSYFKADFRETGTSNLFLMTKGEKCKNAKKNPQHLTLNLYNL